MNEIAITTTNGHEIKLARGEKGLVLVGKNGEYKVKRCDRKVNHIEITIIKADGADAVFSVYYAGDKKGITRDGMDFLGSFLR